MAKNRQPEPKQHESSSDDINEDDSDTESESEPEQQFAIKPSADKNLKATADPQSSSSGEYSDSDSGEDTPPRRPEKSLKSINSKPTKVDSAKASKKSISKPIPATPPLTKPSAAAKRSVDSDANGDRASKKPKKKKEADVGIADATPKKKKEDDAGIAETPKKGGEDSKNKLFQRLFSKEDEIAMLEGLIQYKEKKGTDPINDLTGFHEFIKKDLHVDVTKSQISQKVRRLKKKVLKNIAGAKDGKERKFSNPHEQKAYELSKRVWSVEANGDGVDGSKVVDATPKKKAKSDVVTSPNEVTKMEVASDAVVSLPLPAQLASSYGRRKSVEEMILDDGLELVDGSKKLELQEKWKQLKAEEIKLYLKRLRLMQEQAEAVLLALQ